MGLLLGQAKSLHNKAPVPHSPGRASTLFSFGSKTSAKGQMEAYGAVGTLFAIVSQLANATSQVEWHLYRKPGPLQARRGYERQEVYAHPALTVWNKPNSFYTRQEFIEAFQQHIDLTGESEWVIGYDPRVAFPTELWCVRPDRMEPQPDKEAFLKGWVYTSPDGQKVPLTSQEVIQLRMPNPMDPYRGQGPVQAIMTDLQSSQAAAAYNRNFFLNNAEPGGVIEVDRRLGDDEFDEMSKRWNEQHRGVANAHRVAIIEQGEYKPITNTMRDMEFSSLRTISGEIIREAFAFPKFMLGAPEGSNRASATAARAIYSEQLIVPRLERIKQALNNDFLPLFGPIGDTVEFDYDSPVPDDFEEENATRDSKIKALVDLTSKGFEVDDVLEFLDLPPMRYKERSESSGPEAAPDEAPAGEDPAEQDGLVPDSEQG